MGETKRREAPTSRELKEGEEVGWRDGQAWIYAKMTYVVKKMARNRMRESKFAMEAFKSLDQNMQMERRGEEEDKS